MLQKRLADLGRKRVLEPAARCYILSHVDTRHYGARPIRRILEKEVENQIASLLVSEKESHQPIFPVNASKSGLVVSTDDL